MFGIFNGILTGNGEFSARSPRYCKGGYSSTRFSLVLPSLSSYLFNVEVKFDVFIGDDGIILKSPGRLKRHYSPRARLKLCSWKDDADLLLKLGGEKSLARTHIIAHTRIPSGEPFAGVSVIPHDTEAFARAIYAELHRCDEAGAELIVVEDIPNSSEWRAIGDRLKRAASQS